MKNVKGACPYSGVGGKSPHERTKKHDESPYLLGSQLCENLLVLLLVGAFYAWIYS